MRRLKQMPPESVLLFEDWTILRMFPPLRHCWAWRGRQAVVRITGQNARRVLFGILNVRTGHRVVLRRRWSWQGDFQALLHELRRRYRHRPVWLLLDRAPSREAVIESGPGRAVEHGTDLAAEKASGIERNGPVVEGAERKDLG